MNRPASSGVVYDSSDSPLLEFSDSDPGVVVEMNSPMSAAELLAAMRSRIEVFGSPLPDGYVPPLGIDIDELLRQVPWPPADAAEESGHS